MGSTRCEIWISRQRGRGLKLGAESILYNEKESPPTRGRGLKQSASRPRCTPEQAAAAEVYDYVDETVPTLRRMTEKRIRGYHSLGYAVQRPGGDIAA